MRADRPRRSLGRDRRHDRASPACPAHRRGSEPLHLFERKYDDVVDHCAKEGIIFVPYFPLRDLRSVALPAIAEQHGATPAQIAPRLVAATLSPPCCQSPALCRPSTYERILAPGDRAQRRGVSVPTLIDDRDAEALQPMRDGPSNEPGADPAAGDVMAVRGLARRGAQRHLTGCWDRPRRCPHRGGQRRRPLFSSRDRACRYGGAGSDRPDVYTSGAGHRLRSPGTGRRPAQAPVERCDLALQRTAGQRGRHRGPPGSDPTIIDPTIATNALGAARASMGTSRRPSLNRPTAKSREATRPSSPTAYRRRSPRSKAPANSSFRCWRRTSPGRPPSTSRSTH